jgi:hypothetical protein
LQKLGLALNTVLEEHAFAPLSGTVSLPFAACMHQQNAIKAAAESLRGKGGLPDCLQTPADPENIRAAKEWLSRHMPRGRSYAETADQVAFTSQFDLEMARRSDSFDKYFCQHIYFGRKISNPYFFLADSSFGGLLSHLTGSGRDTEFLRVQH